MKFVILLQGGKKPVFIKIDHKLLIKYICPLSVLYQLLLPNFSYITVSSPRPPSFLQLSLISCSLSHNFSLWLNISLPPPYHNFLLSLFVFAFLDLLCSLSIYLICFQGSLQPAGQWLVKQICLPPPHVPSNTPSWVPVMDSTVLPLCSICLCVYVSV